MGKLSIQGILIFLVISQLNANEPFPVYRIKEVKFEGGVAAATSYYDNRWVPANAFTEQNKIDGTNIGWHSGKNTGGVSANLPQYIWYDFKTISIRPAEISFQPAQSGDAMQGTPTAYQFIGSNDDVCNMYATWTVLCEDMSDKVWRNTWEVRYCKVKPEVTEKFRCFGIRVLKNRRKDGWTSIRNIRMWELRTTDAKQEL